MRDFRGGSQLRANGSEPGSQVDLLLATLLIDVGAPVKLTQEIMRHANSRITLKLYQQVTMVAKQELQARVVSAWYQLGTLPCQVAL